EAFVGGVSLLYSLLYEGCTIAPAMVGASARSWLAHRCTPVWRFGASLLGAKVQTRLRHCCTQVAGTPAPCWLRQRGRHTGLPGVGQVPRVRGASRAAVATPGRPAP